MTRRPGSGKTPRQVPGATSPGSGIEREATTPEIALPADLGRSLRLLDDAQLDRLAEAVTDEVRRRGRSMPRKQTANTGSPRPTVAKEACARPDKLERASTVTAGQERLILAAFDAGLRPAAIAKEFRVSRSTVQHVITHAKRDRRRMERKMVEGYGRTDRPRKLNARASDAMTGADALPAAHWQGSRRRPAFGTPDRHGIRRRDETRRNVCVTRNDNLPVSTKSYLARSR